MAAEVSVTVLAASEDKDHIQSTLFCKEGPSEEIKPATALQTRLSFSSTSSMPERRVVQMEKQYHSSYSTMMENLPHANLDKMDKGYAWVILLCCAILQLIPNIPMASAGLFYMEFVESCGMDAQTASWMCSLQTSIAHMFGPISAILVDLTSTRTVTLIGCLGSGVTLSIASFSTDQTTLFVMYGLLTGVFFNCIYIPTMSYSTSFFDKYKTLALSACTCFVPLVTVIFTPCITFFIQTFSWRDSLLFIGAICIQFAVFAVLLRPARLKALEAENCKTVPSTLNQLATSTFSLFNESKKVNSEKRSSLSLYTHCENAYEMGQSATIKPDLTLDIIASQNLCEIATLRGVDDDLGIQERCKVFGKYQSVLHWRVAVLVTSFLVHGWAAGIFFILLPEFASARALSAQQISHLLMITGLVGFTCRVFFTLVGYKVKGSKAVTVPMSLLIMAITFTGIIFSTDYIHFVITSSVYIFGYAGITCYTGPVILEMHGESHLGVLFGMEMFGYGVGSALAPPTSTWLYMLTGSYTSGLILCSAVLVIGAIMYIPHIISTRHKREQADLS